MRDLLPAAQATYHKPSHPPTAPLQNVYANMGGNVLVHVSAPALGLAAAQWAVVSWGESQVMRESITDAKYIYRYTSWCPSVHLVPCLCILKSPTQVPAVLVK